MATVIKVLTGVGNVTLPFNWFRALNSIFGEGAAGGSLAGSNGSASFGAAGGTSGGGGNLGRRASWSTLRLLHLGPPHRYHRGEAPGKLRKIFLVGRRVLDEGIPVDFPPGLRRPCH